MTLLAREMRRLGLRDGKPVPVTGDYGVIKSRFGDAPTTGGRAVLAAFRPALRDARDDVADGYLTAASRAIHSVQNSGWLAGAVEQTEAFTVGTGLRLAPRPDRVILGWSEGEADAWSEIIERQWLTWSGSPYDCDIAGMQTVDQMAATQLRMWIAYGEALALLPAIRRHGSSTRLKVQLLQPHWLSQDTDAMGRMFQGVRVDAAGLPIGYRIQRDATSGQTIDIAARDGTQRPQVVHLFKGNPGQTRGITPLAPVLRVIRQFDQMADATLTQALIHAIFAATIESDAPPEHILQALAEAVNADGKGERVAAFDAFMDYTSGWHQGTQIDVGTSGRVAHLGIGESLKLNRSDSPNANYERFSRFLLLEIAKCLGLTYEAMTGDYSDATYSSVRSSTAANWPIVQMRREAIPVRFKQAVYEAWLDEGIADGRLPFKGGYQAFVAHRNAACAADWRGPPKPAADDLKAAKAAEIYKRL
ncbi:MAG TPA: phage portal protein, partial [Pseudorhodoferax sp.]|nr:phage portal protein [Pseudorhodoferax sp.]